MIAPLKTVGPFAKMPVPFVAPIKTEMPSDDHQHQHQHRQLQQAEVEDVKRMVQQRYAENNFSNKLGVRPGRPDGDDSDVCAVQKLKSSLSVNVSQLSNSAKDASGIPYCVLLNQQRVASVTLAEHPAPKTRIKRKSCATTSKNGDVKRKK